MKFLNKKQKNNKGFSLVELIVVIAIMVVLVVVLVPVFTKYIESSRRSTDVTNANTISEAVLTEVVDNPDAVKAGDAVEVNDTNIANMKSINSAPKVQGKKVESAKGNNFFYKYDKEKNVCYVYVDNTVAADDEHNLTTEAGANKYKED